LSLLPLLCCTCPATPSIYPLSLPDALPIYLSDLDPGDADDRASLEPLDVIEARFERIAVPRKPAGAADGNDQQRGQRQRDHGHHADLQFRPGQRTCARHTVNSLNSQLPTPNCQLPTAKSRQKRVNVRVAFGRGTKLARVPL